MATPSQMITGLSKKVKDLTKSNKSKDQEIAKLKQQLAGQETPQHIDWDWGALPDAPLICKPTKAPRKSPVRKIIPEDSLCQCRRYVKIAQQEKVRIGGQIIDRNAQCTYAHRHTIGGYNVCNHHKRQIEEDKLAFGYIGDDLEVVVKKTPKNVQKFYFNEDASGEPIDELMLMRRIKDARPKKSPVLKEVDYDLATLEAMLSAKKVELGM